MKGTRQNVMAWLWKNSGTLLALAVALLTAVALLMGGVSARLDEDALSLQATFAGGVRIDYDDIRAAQLMDGLDRGQRLSGVRSARILAGQYLNDSFGGYLLYVYANVPSCIDLRTDAGHVVFNAATDEQTRALYEQLLERLPDVP